jgi:hypothetical protein
MRRYRGTEFELPDGYELQIDDVLYLLTGGDLSKAALVEARPVQECYDWYFMERLKRINEGWNGFM